MRWLRSCLVLVVACGGPSGPNECDDGDTRACYQGAPSTRGVGACMDGIESCTRGEWTGVCSGDVTPFVERCDGRDDDCDGTIDDVDGAGAGCTAGDGCDGETACRGMTLTCIAPPKNECGVCGGPSVTGLGGTCMADGCPGVLACNTAGDAAVCDAPPENACGVCGGPMVSGLGDACAGPSNCPGVTVCNASGTSTACDCNPVPGMCDDGGTLRPVVSPNPGDLVITEVMPSPTAVSDTAGEWFEVRAMIDLDLNQVLLDRAGDSLASQVIASASCIRVATGTHLVFARNPDPAMNGGLPAVQHAFSFSLITGSAATPGDVRLLFGANVLDAVTWTGSATGRSRALDPDLVDPIANDSEASFCDGTTSYGTGTPQDRGTPGASNDQCPLVVPPGMCDDGGTLRAIVKPAAGALVISEFLANPAGSTDSTREWFEIANTGGAAFDLNELTLGRVSGSGTPIVSVACKSIAAGAFALFARSADPAQNGMLPGVDATFGFALVDTNGDVEVRDGTTVLDAITWTSVMSGVSRQLDPDLFTTTANDLGTSFCAGTTPYGDATNLGTPKAANAQCP